MSPHNIEIYTDGSCNTQSTFGAWASIIIFNNQKIVLKGEEANTTHNRMELLSVIESIRYCEKHNFSAPITVYSDSQYVVLLIDRKEKLKQKRFFTNKGESIKNSDLVQTLIAQIESHQIRFIKVKAHQKSDSNPSIYNNEVDKLSRKTVREKRG